MHDGRPQRWLPTESQTASLHEQCHFIWKLCEKWWFRWETTHRRHAFRMTPERRKQIHIWTPTLKCKSEQEHHFNAGKKKKPRWKSQSRNEFSWEYGNVMKMSAVAWIHSMDGEIICVEAKKKKRKWKKHPWQLMAMAELTQGDWRVSLNKQLTEREWRRPLTWLDRLRDAVRLPASWGDENIQPHSVNKYLKTNLLFFFKNKIFDQLKAPPGGGIQVPMNNNDN